jgi:hypothetical protein
MSMSLIVMISDSMQDDNVHEPDRDGHLHPVRIPDE